MFPKRTPISYIAQSGPQDRARLTLFAVNALPVSCSDRLQIPELIWFLNWASNRTPNTLGQSLSNFVLQRGLKHGLKAWSADHPANPRDKLQIVSSCCSLAGLLFSRPIVRSLLLLSRPLLAWRSQAGERSKHCVLSPSSFPALAAAHTAFHINQRASCSFVRHQLRG